MKTTISVIGGDKRIEYLAQMLKQEKFNIKTFGMENSEMICKEDKCSSIKECIENSKIIISSIPFSKDDENVFAPYAEKNITIDELKKYTQNKILIAGSIKEEIQNKFINTKIYDLMKDESLTIMNAVSTAEGAIQIAMQETNQTIHNSKVLILGFGRIGKVLSKNLLSLGANVTCEARKKSDIAWIESYGYKSLELNNLEENINIYEIIFNTIPYLILNKNILKNVRKDCLIIDLASKPGGTDFEECKKLGINAKLELALPGRVAPKTSAKYIKQSIYNIMEGEKWEQ